MQEQPETPVVDTCNVDVVQDYNLHCMSNRMTSSELKNSSRRCQVFQQEAEGYFDTWKEV